MDHQIPGTHVFRVRARIYISMKTNALFARKDQKVKPGLLLRPLRTVLGAGLLPVGYSCSIKSASDNMVSGTGQILDTAAPDQNNAMLLKVVALTRNIARNFDTIGKTYPGDLPQS